VALILFIAYTLMASWAVLMFRHRRGDQIYITQWYLLGAFLWFPWLYAATIDAFVVPVQGVCNRNRMWYSNILLFLWFGAIALGSAYYMIQVIGRPVYSYHLATIGFGLMRFSQAGRNDTTRGRPVSGVDDYRPSSLHNLALIPVATVGSIIT